MLHLLKISKAILRICLSLQVSPFLKHDTGKSVKIAMDEPSEKWVCEMYLRPKSQKITIHRIRFLCQSNVISIVGWLVACETDSSL